MINKHTNIQILCSCKDQTTRRQKLSARTQRTHPTESLIFEHANEGIKFRKNNQKKVDKKLYKIDSRNRKNYEIKLKIHLGEDEHEIEKWTVLSTWVWNDFAWVSLGRKTSKMTQKMLKTEDNKKNQPREHMAPLPLDTLRPPRMVAEVAWLRGRSSSLDGLGFVAEYMGERWKICGGKMKKITSLEGEGRCSGLIKENEDVLMNKSK